MSRRTVRGLTAGRSARQTKNQTLKSTAHINFRGDGVEAVTPIWEGLSDGATVLQELKLSPWASAYGMLTDRFGVTWVIDVAADPGATPAM